MAMNNVGLYEGEYGPKIKNLERGAIFRLRELAPNPPALVGRLVARDHKQLGIEPVENPGGDCMLWKKL